MTTVLLDLWEDLREKRLWPVAVGLLAAIAAVPLVLFKPASGPPAQAPQASATHGPQLPVVSVAGGPLEGSQLNQFAQKNPFIPLSDLTHSSSPAAASSGGSSSPSVHASAASGSSPATSGSGGSGGSSAPSASQPSSGGASGSSTSPQWFRYTADIKFGPSGKLKTINGVHSLALLPNKQSPVVMFMGATSDGQNAVFFVDDQSYSASGKGVCNAPGAACRFVSLSTSKNSETFSANGKTTYKLELLRINRQSFTPSSSASSSKVTSAAADSALVFDLLSLVDAGTQP